MIDGFIGHLRKQGRGCVCGGCALTTTHVMAINHRPSTIGHQPLTSASQQLPGHGATFQARVAADKQEDTIKIRRLKNRFFEPTSGKKNGAIDHRQSIYLPLVGKMLRPLGYTWSTIFRLRHGRCGDPPPPPRETCYEK